MIEHISHYRVEREIGRGGMGVVYRAIDTRLGRPVALKMLESQATADDERHRRFVQEARAASALNHPNIVTIYEIGDDAGTTFIAMELVEGTPLDRLLAAGPLPVPTALEYAAQMAGALDAAHANGIIHRDIKPANIVITADGRAKVLDFGLAKLVERPASDATISGMATQPGLIVGTVAYMSPEQAQGHAVDARSDIFSLGAVLYEMLAGKRPFAGTSDVGVITAILRDEPPSPRTIRASLPAALDPIVSRALAKEPQARYQTAGALRADVAAVQASLTRPPEAGWRRPRVLIPAAMLLLAVAAFGGWQTVHASRVRWARGEGLHEIDRLHLSGRTMRAVATLAEIERYAPDEAERVRATWNPFRIVTVPDGATVEVKNYSDLEGPWTVVGPSPTENFRLPLGYYRVRISKPGFKTIEVAAPAPGRTPIVLTPADSVAPGMVFLPARRAFGVGVATPVDLPDFWIGQFEVTNAEYKRFVDAGGYRDPKYWKEPFRDGDRVLTFEEAMARFRDATNRSGPSTWELGTHLDGQADFPVSGISWFEASAYAQFAGKSLPSVYHWFYAAGIDELYSDLLTLSNFDGKGPEKVGARQGLGPWGTFDMAGNVKEWAVNGVAGSSRRYILGGGFNEPNYRFAEQDAQEPWTRFPAYGMRLVDSRGDAVASAAPVGRVTPDPSTLVPVSAEEFEGLKAHYTYDRLPLDARVDDVDDSSPYWRKEKVSYASAATSERIPAYLFLPKNAAPPYQTIVLFPNAYARQAPSSASLDLGTFEFIVRSGRALLYPVYQGTFERRKNLPPTSSRNVIRDVHIQWAKDFFRSVDYLETRKDVDMSKLGYYSLSMGAYFGPIPVALEPRIKVAVFASGGLRYNYPQETQPANFMPRVTVPVLLINGKTDFGVPIDAQKRYLELLGTPPAHKKHVALEGGHIPNDRIGSVREVLDWYDKYLGPVR